MKTLTGRAFARSSEKLYILVRTKANARKELVGVNRHLCLVPEPLRALARFESYDFASDVSDALAALYPTLEVQIVAASALDELSLARYEKELHETHV